MTHGALLRGLLADGAVRLLLVEVFGPAEEARRRHQLNQDAAHLTAQGMVAASLLSAHIKGAEQLTLQLQGERPRLSMYIDMTGEGHTRARTTPSSLSLQSGLHGAMLVTKSIRDRELYRGITAIEGDLEDALAQHLRSSTQVNGLLRISSRLSAEGTVTQAGGLLLERLPATKGIAALSDEAFQERYGFIQEAEVSKLLAELAFGTLRGEAVQILEKKDILWRCRCSQERVLSTLSMLSHADLREMIEEDDGAEVTCHFCNEVYKLDAAALMGLLPS